MRLKEILGIAALSFALQACVSNPGVVQLSPDTYIITRTDKAGIFGNAARMKADVIQEANDFAAAQGKVAIPISTHEKPMGTGPAQFATMEYQFRVVSKDDPEYGRATLLPGPDVVIQDDKTIDVTIDDKRQESEPSKDVYTELLKLDDLRSRGILSEEEFQEQKRRLLAK